MPKKFEIITPRSYNDSAYEAYEYLLRWIGRDGSDYELLFYDAEIDNRIDSEAINTESDDYIQALIYKVGKKITLVANDLSKNDLEIIGQIFENPIIRRIRKDDTEEKFAPERGNFKYRLLDGRYRVEFTIIATEIKTWK